jgi:hypothetical protein
MNSISSLSVSPLGLVVTIVSLSVPFFLVTVVSEPTIASAQLVGSARQQEREFRTGLPKHVPLKIKAKNVNSEKWTTDLEIEVMTEGWESFRKMNGKPHPSKIGLVFQSLNFGDGTGFSDAQGTFINVQVRI